MLRNDMVDALATWQGLAVDADRRDELLARLRTDEVFCREFAEALWTLAMLRVVQAPEPRWLSLSEELGLCGVEEDGSVDEGAEEAIMAEVRRKPHRIRLSLPWRTFAMVAAGVLALFLWFLFIAKGRNTEKMGITEVLPSERKLAVLAGESGAVWESDPLIAGGNWVRPGSHRLLAGSDTLLFFNGIRVRLQAPLEFSLVNEGTVSCHRGAMRVTVANGAAGFRVNVPFGVVTDLGTDFAVSVGADDATRVAVMEGTVELGIRQQEDDGIRLISMAPGEAVEVSATGNTQPASTNGVPPPPDSSLLPLKLPDAYADLILAGKPRHYWRLDRMENGKIPDVTGRGNPLLSLGPLAVSADGGGRHSLRLSGKGGVRSQHPWRLRTDGAALELWFASEGNQQSSLVGMATRELDSRHFAMLSHNSYLSEAAPRSQMLNTVRFLTRWPIDVRGGVNLFSEPVIGPYSWHHVVIQIKGRRMELHVDGMPVKVATADPLPKTIDAFLTLGFAHTMGRDGLIEGLPDRFLIGRIAEVAVYDRVLSPKEIRQRLGK